MERSRPLNAVRRYYPGFLGALFLILLRIAIGWHFLTEGLNKYETTAHGDSPFSAEGYLRNSTGPFAPYFRGMLPDPNGLALLDPERLKARWAETATGISRHYGFDEDQKAQVGKLLSESELWADYWFHSYENREQRDKYYHDLAAVMAIERNPNALSFERERAEESRQALNIDRRTLTEPLLERSEDLKAAIVGLATPEQKEAARARYEFRAFRSILPDSMAASYDVWLDQKAEYQPPATLLDTVNMMTTYGLILIGACLILGFLTPFAALCATAFLAMIYLSMPPLSGLPPNPRLEGHYWIVNKNLIELIACLVIATTPTGHWLGLDALFFGARRRRRLARLEAQTDDATRTDERTPVHAANQS